MKTRSFLKFLSSLALGGLLFVQPHTAVAQDSDGDGLPDAVEQQLLSTYRPWLYYDNDETVWPCSATWFVQHSTEINIPACDNIPESALRDNPRLALKSGTWTSTTRNSPLKLNIADDMRRGPFASDPAQSANVPIYGHAMPLSDSGESSLAYPGFAQTFGSGYIVLQYWILFPYNDAHYFDNPFTDNPGDHEGDWVWIDVILGAASHFPQYVVYHHHGDNNINPSVWAWAFVEKRDGAPVVYLEKGTHELWPTAGEHEVFYVEPHYGNGLRYRPTTVVNLGEAGRPLTQSDSSAQVDCELALLFNGEWGDFTGEGGTSNPGGPINQSWGAQLRFPIPPPSYSLVWVDFGATYDTCTKASGSYPFPYPTLANGADAVGTGGTVSIKAGGSPETITISKPMTIMSVGGTATIGQ